jgi:hypothetical protein
VYISFQDGRRVSQEDPGMGFLGSPGCTGSFNAPRYCFGDAYVTRSTTSGASWEPRVRVHPADGRTDQFMPALEVDDAGQVLVLFYDRADDPRNFLLEPALLTSVDGGQTWNPQPLAAGQPSPPITSWQDFLASPFYMGDYIGVAVDATGSLPGVLSSWGDMVLGDQNVAYEAP